VFPALLVVDMTWYYLTQQDWDALQTEMGSYFDVESRYYLPPNQSKKSQKPLINEDRTMLLLWENQGATIGTWQVWTRLANQGTTNRTTGITTIRPNIPFIAIDSDATKIIPRIDRRETKLTPAQKRKVDRHNRIKNWKDYVSLLSQELYIYGEAPGEGQIYRLDTSQLQPILNPDGSSPYSAGFPFEPENLYVINWNARSPRIIDN